MKHHQKVPALIAAAHTFDHMTNKLIRFLFTGVRSFYIQLQELFLILASFLRRNHDMRQRATFTLTIIIHLIYIALFKKVLKDILHATFIHHKYIIYIMYLYI